MHEHRHHLPGPPTWSEAFAALPMSDPPDRWPSLASNATNSRHRAISIFAVAAMLVAALALPWKLQHEAAPVPSVSRAAPAPHGELDTLYAQSARLEALLEYARDDRVASGAAVSLATRYDARIASIDGALAQTDLPLERQRALWQARVDTLRALVAFEANRRWLVAQGAHYDGTVVRVD
jgi:hypothetical protein